MKPEDRARLLHGYGMIQCKIGQQMGKREVLEESIAAFRLALKELPREEMPTAWVSTQNNLGNSLTALGKLEGGTARLHEAVTVYSEALLGFVSENDPFLWAMTLNNLGDAWEAIGEEEAGTEGLDKAVEVYQLTLKTLKDFQTQVGEPDAWDLVQSNYCYALMKLGLRETGTVHLEAAAAAYREALKEKPRGQRPGRRTGLQTNFCATFAPRRAGGRNQTLGRISRCLPRSVG